jgi:hypothetical protein
MRKVNHTEENSRKGKMRTLVTLFVLWLLAATASPAKDKAATYQEGTFLSKGIFSDGTTTDYSVCGSDSAPTCNLKFVNNTVIQYKAQVANGTWKLETYTEAADSTVRQFGITPMHFKSEKNNPLDFLHNGDKFLFRIEKHRKLNGIETDVYIPFADHPNKEARYVGWFAPTMAIPPPPSDKPTNNVKAMCDAHKLPPALENQFCSNQTTPEARQPSTAEAAPTADMANDPVAMGAAKYNELMQQSSAIIEEIGKQHPETLRMICNTHPELSPQACSQLKRQSTSSSDGTSK